MIAADPPFFENAALAQWALSVNLPSIGKSLIARLSKKKYHMYIYNAQSYIFQGQMSIFAAFTNHESASGSELLRFDRLKG